MIANTTIFKHNNNAILKLLHYMLSNQPFIIIIFFNQHKIKKLKIC